MARSFPGEGQAQQAEDLLKSLVRYATRRRTEEDEHPDVRPLAQDPIPLFVEALRETIAYIRARREGAAQDNSKEGKLSDLWYHAGEAVRPIDPGLASRCIMKGLAWSDPVVYKRAKAKGIKIDISDMEDALSDLMRAQSGGHNPMPGAGPASGSRIGNKMPGTGTGIPEDGVRRSRTGLPTPYDLQIEKEAGEREEREKAERAQKQHATDVANWWLPVAGVGFAIFFVVFLVYLIIVPTTFNDDTRNILNVLMAFCVAASAAFLTGTAAASGKIPFFKESPVVFSAAGGVGVFVLVYLLLYYTNTSRAPGAPDKSWIWNIPTNPRAQTTVKYQVCVGQYESNCPPHNVFVGCSDVEAWAAKQCQKLISKTQLSVRGGNACGYAVFEIECTANQ